MAWIHRFTHTCPDGSEYAVESMKIPVRDKDSLYCPNCRAHLKTWNESHTYELRQVTGPAKPSEE